MVSSSLRHRRRRVDRDLGDPGLVEPEHHPALEHRGGVVEVHDGPRCPGQALVGALDQVLAALGQHLDHHVVGDQVLFDELAHEVEVGLAGRREADLDLLEAHLDQHVEHAALAVRVHGIDEGLVAVAQVHRAPPGRHRGALIGPGPVGQRERQERLVLLERHLLGLDVLGWHRWHLGARGQAGVVKLGGRWVGETDPENARSSRPGGTGASASTDMWRSPRSEGGVRCETASRWSISDGGPIVNPQARSRRGTSHSRRSAMATSTTSGARVISTRAPTTARATATRNGRLTRRKAAP